MFCFETLSLILSPKQTETPLLSMLGKWGGMEQLETAEVEVKYEIGVVADTKYKNTRCEPAKGVHTCNVSIQKLGAGRWLQL